MPILHPPSLGDEASQSGREGSFFISYLSYSVRAPLKRKIFVAQREVCWYYGCEVMSSIPAAVESFCFFCFTVGLVLFLSTFTYSGPDPVSSERLPKPVRTSAREQNGRRPRQDVQVMRAGRRRARKPSNCLGATHHQRRPRGN